MERITGTDDGGVEWRLHRYRYEVARKFTRKSDTVLDCACGNGYGREILRGAWHGVDKIMPKDFRGVTATFTEADLCTWVPPFDYDIFVGLETIEHLESIDAYVAAAKRAKLTIVISTPIIPTVHFNPFHVRDFTKDSLEALFDDWDLIHYEPQVDPNFGPEPVYGIWAWAR